MYSSFKALLLILVASFALSGCGDLLGKKVVKRELDSSQFEAQCTLDISKFEHIMHENIGPHIRCLGENLNLFIKMVKTGKHGYLSRVQLEQYMAERPDVAPEVVRALKAIFDLGHLITGEDPDYISKKTVDKVINFALVFNKEAALHFGPIFENEAPATYALHLNHRDRVSAANKKIVEELRKILNRNGKTRKLNIIRLLESFTTDSTSDFINKTKKVLFLKKVILGGNSEVITHTELEKLLFSFDQLITIALDAIRYKHILLNQESLLHLLKKDVTDFYNIITRGSLNDRDEEVLFKMDDAIEAAKMFLDEDDFEVEKFRGLILEAKVIAMSGNKDVVTGGELKKLFEHAKSLLQTGTVFHRIYDRFKIQLDSGKPVEETIDFDSYRHTYADDQAELDQFERIAKKYRFMKGEFIASYYTRNYKRNADAFFEIALFEYVIKLVMMEYGTQTPGTVGGYTIDKDQMQALVKKFENELIELDLLTPQKAISTADNVSLLGTLFQYQSDTNGLLDVNEATEFAISLFSSLNISADLHEFMKDNNCSVDEFDRTNPECFRANFWQGLCSEYKNHFPLLFESFGVTKSCDEMVVTQDMNVFLDRSINAARTCNYYTDGQQEEIPYSEGDIMTIMLAMMHAETTIIRWDRADKFGNHKNYMDANDVNRAYEIYAPALDGFLQDKSPLIQKLKKQIFQYMIKYEQVPNEKDFGSVWKFVKFLLSFKHKAPAYRKTIVSLLGVIAEENKKLQTGPQFDCSLMRDPVNIPREPLLKNRQIKVGNGDSQNLVLSGLKFFFERYTAYEKQAFTAELEAFAEDMIAGKVQTIKDVKQKSLRSLFQTIAKNSALMEEIEAAVLEGDELHKIAFAVTAILTE
jgi:hypothetical protein